jgi:hypothetical protein
MVGFSEKGKFEYLKVPGDRTWRAEAGQGTQNYYGRVCNGCSQMIRCKQGCSDLKSFGGHSE